jgi:hypothetical protein
MKTFDKLFWKYFIPFLVMIFVILFFPYLFTQLSWVDFILASPDSLGTTIGGTMGPFIAILAAGLTFMAFWVQYKANVQQRADIKVERFENRYYEMLKWHRDNVSQFEIANLHKGQKAIVQMYREFTFIWKVCDQCIKYVYCKDSKSTLNYSPAQKTQLAYTIFFFGVGEISEKGNRHYLPEFDSELVEIIFQKLRKAQNKFDRAFSRQKDYKSINIKIGGTDFKYESNYFPFDGHSSRLGHYYRHLYQSVKMAVTENFYSDLLSEEEVKLKRYQYVKLLRVQLSNHEQALMYFNAFFVAGQVWWEDSPKDDLGNEKQVSYFLEWRIIKNVPFNLVKDFAPHPVHEFYSRLVNRGWDIESKDGKLGLKKRLKESFEWITEDILDDLIKEDSGSTKQD